MKNHFDSIIHILHCKYLLWNDTLMQAHKKTSASLDSDHPPSDAPLRVVFSFYATTIVSAITTMPRMKESFLGALVPFLVRGLKQDYPDYNGATYMIICQLGVSANLKNSLLEPLMEAMCQVCDNLIFLFLFRPSHIKWFLGLILANCESELKSQTYYCRMFTEIVQTFYFTSTV